MDELNINSDMMEFIYFDYFDNQYIVGVNNFEGWVQILIYKMQTIIMS